MTEPSERPRSDSNALVARVTADLERAGALPEGSAIVDARVMAIDPAYVVFGLEDRPLVEAAHRFLASRGITSLGRYGKWEYSSMSSCIRDGRAWAEELACAGHRQASVMGSS